MDALLPQLPQCNHRDLCDVCYALRVGGAGGRGRGGGEGAAGRLAVGRTWKGGLGGAGVCLVRRLVSEFVRRLVSELKGGCTR